MATKRSACSGTCHQETDESYDSCDDEASSAPASLNRLENAGL